MKKKYLTPKTKSLEIVDDYSILASSDDNFLENVENEDAGVKVESIIWY